MTCSPNIAPGAEPPGVAGAQNDRDQGLALVSVIFALAILSVIALAMISLNISAGRAKAHLWAQTQIDALTQAAIVQSVLAISDPIITQRWPVDGRHVSWRFQGQDIKLSIQDEAGKIDLNEANDALIHGLFRAVGLAPDAADAQGDKVLDWRTPGNIKRLNGATPDDYEHAGYSYRPRGGPYQSIEEVLLVMGMTPELFAKIKPAITVYSQHAMIEPATAPDLALRALPGASGESGAALLGARGLRPGGAVPVGVLDPIIPLAGRAFSIDVSMILDGKAIERHCVLRLTGDPKRPYLMLEWQ